MSEASLAAVEITPKQPAVGSVIWLHGLGADGHDFAPAVPELERAGIPPLRFVFPHAPVRAVTLNSGYAMRAWYDIIALDRHAAQDEVGIRASDAVIGALIERERAQGVPSERIVLAGFSQGGAMALFSGTRHSGRLAGIVALSCYLLLENTLQAEGSPTNAATPIFMAHGDADTVVAPLLGSATRDRLRSAGYSVDWHSYRMPHSVCAAELLDIAAFLRRVMA